MNGTSTLVPGKPYSLYIHVPEGQTVDDVQADAEVMFHTQKGEFLEVKFSGEGLSQDNNQIHWSIIFTKG